VETSTDRGRLVALGFVAYCTGFVAWLLTATPGEAKTYFNDLGFIPAGTLATILAVQAARTPGLGRDARRAWLGLAVACATYLSGDLLWLLYEVVLKEPPSPSPASLLYLAYYPLFLFGLLCYPTVLKDRSRRLEFWLDAIIVLLGGSMVVWHLVLEPAAVLGRGSMVASALYLAYPALDLVLLLAAAVTVLAIPEDPARPAFLWLVTGLGVDFVADLIQGRNALQGSFEAGGVADGLFMFHWLCYGVSAYVFRRRAPEGVAAGEAPLPRAINLLPYAASVVGYGVLIVAMNDLWSTGIGGLVGCAVALTAVVLVRQAVAERTNLRLQGERAARKSEARFRALVQNASDVIVVVDAAQRMRYLTPSVEGVLGHRGAELLGAPLAELLHPEDQSRGLDLLAEATHRTTAAGPSDWRVRQADGTWRNVEVTALGLLNEPDIQGVVVTLRDVHERKSLEDRISYLAFYDPLTGLANRALLVDRLAHSLAWARREGRSLSLLCLDLDHFQAVNDGLGHRAGDQVLAEVGRRIQATLRTTDTAARLGGDEFGLLLEDTSDARAATLAADRLLEALRVPIALETGETGVSASVGIAMSHGGSERPDELLRNADVALYEAKQAGRNRALVFEPGQHAAVIERLETETDLRRALERSELELLYQPIVSLRTGAPAGAEALLRWQHPRRGRLLPGTFVGLAEERDLIVPIGRWVLVEACRRAATWAAEEEDSVYVSVNLSGRQLQDPGFVGDVRAALGASGLPASRLTLEITESFSLLETRAIVGRLYDLRDLGVRLAIDDFGTGYSSLSYLQTLPMTVLKIDRAFVTANSPRAAPVLRGIVELGKAMGLGLVAEGIETTDQVARLRELGCEHGQGFLFARPLEGDRIDRLLADPQPLSMPGGR
jgi:diguanylate cyclase (GGDEF)-like protein/PAS domain S-box-containing protein